MDPATLTFAFCESISGDREIVADSTHRMMEIIRRMPGGKANFNDVRLALHEALSNAVIHGNRENPGKTASVFGACEANQGLLLVITDEGDGFDPSSVPDPTAGESIYATSGRGVYMIHQLMTEVEYRRGGRQVILRKAMPAR